MSGDAAQVTETTSNAADKLATITEQKIEKLAADLFKKTDAYVRSELEVTLEDYELLEKMNQATANKYREMQGMSTTVAASLSDLESNYEALQPFLDKIDGLDDKVSRLENLAYAIDSYSKRLEGKFKALEKASNK